MSVKVMKGLVPQRSGYTQIKPGAISGQQSVQFGAASVSANPALSRSLSDAVVAAVKGRKGALVSDKIREYREAKEVSDEVADKIRDTDQGVEAHDKLDSFAGRTQLTN